MGKFGLLICQPKNHLRCSQLVLNLNMVTISKLKIQTKKEAIMKQKITIAAFMFLVTLFAFGQKTVHENIEPLWKSKIDRQLKSLKQKDHTGGQNNLFLKNRNFSQNSNLKSSQSNKQKLDSLVSAYWNETNNQWIAEAKREFTYDTSGNMTQVIYFYKDGTINQWIGFFKIEYAYDASGNMMHELFYGWDETTNQWSYPGKTEYTYDANGNMTQALGSYWDETTNQWVGTEKEEYTYDAHGNMMQLLYSNWNETTNQWVPYTKK